MTFYPGSSSNPSTLLEISLSCSDLVNKDYLSLSDPMCVLSIWYANENCWKEYERTEMQKDNLNPFFTKKFLIEYYFEMRQHLKFTVYDIDNPQKSLSKQDFLGSVEVTLARIASPGTSKHKLRGVRKGEITISVEEVHECKKQYSLQFEGRKLDKKDLFGKSDPFLVLLKENVDGSFSAVYETDFLRSTLSPTWPSFDISMQTLCNGEVERPLRVDCLDWNRDTKPSLIGTFMTTAAELAQGAGLEWVLRNPKKTHKKSYRNSGIIKLVSFAEMEVPSFLDFLQAGLDMNFTVAIDFTASNGNPQEPSSLHYVPEHKSSPILNVYMVAIEGVGGVLQEYDSDKSFPVLGFGAKIPPNGCVSHEFFVNMSTTSPFCHGLAGIFEAYSQAIRRVELYGPTNLSPCINHVARFALQYNDGKQYFVLLIITDGIICDMAATKQAIFQASHLPMSIIIVGVGSADFSAMEELDGKTGPLRAHNHIAARDICQFVSLRNFINVGSTDITLEIRERLAKNVLGRIPQQVTEWMKKHGVTPKSLSKKS